MEDFIKMLYVNNKLNMLYINEKRKKRDNISLLSLYEKLKDYQEYIIDLADREGVDLSVIRTIRIVYID